MQSAKVFLGIIFAIYVLFIFISMIKSKRFFTALFLTVLQGVCALFAVNLIGQYISIHIPGEGKLDREEVIKSLKDGKEILEKVFKKYNPN